MGESNASLCIFNGRRESSTDGNFADGDSGGNSQGDGTYHERTLTILENTGSFLTANSTRRHGSITAITLA
ncbi:MAG TPA: hypothetical protein VMW87_00840 [Spirochaetia bacterium]|nr:hypothetical protein [Spirochaetia bacterium]